MPTHRILERLSELPRELRSMMSDILFSNALLKMEGKEYLKLSDDLEKLWDPLLKWTFVGKFCVHMNERSLPPFDRKTTLAHWIVELIDVPHNELGRPQLLLGQSQSSLMPPTDIQNVQIWRHHHPFFDGDAQILGYFYWGDIFMELDWWREQTNVDLEAVEWIANSVAVSFITKWRGAFQSIKALDIRKSRHTFWVVFFRPGEPDYLSTVSTACLLSAQLLAREGGNKLAPTGLHGDQLTMTLEIARADTNVSHPQTPPPLPKDALEQLGRYLIDQALPGYVKASERFEALLAAEISRIEPHFQSYEARYKKILEEKVFELRTKLDRLQKTRVTFMSEL